MLQLDLIRSQSLPVIQSSRCISGDAFVVRGLVTLKRTETATLSHLR